MKFRRTAAAVAVMLAAMIGVEAHAGSQPFPVKKPSRGLSAFLIKPSEGMKDVSPAGWDRITTSSYGNSALAEEAYAAKTKGAVCATTSYALPKSDYAVSVLFRGEGKARIKGTDAWVDLKSPSPNGYTWVEVGTVKDATEVTVEVGGAGRVFFYGGLLAEGNVVPVAPVAKVMEKIKSGGPVTVVLLGDSVTENAGGKGGGSSTFDKGNPGLMRGFLKEASGQEVDYLAHREPPAWAAAKDPAKLPTTGMGGKTYYESRIELDPARRVHLVNLGKGGAAADWGWSRMGDVIIDNDYLDAKLPKEQHKDSIRFGMAHYKPDVVFINFGTNDVNGAHPDWTVEDYLFHMKVMATNIPQRFGAAVVLSTPHKWGKGVHLATHRQPRMVLALREFCKAGGVALSDVYNEYMLDESDGIHPGDAGHKHIADAYIKAISGRPSVPASKARITAGDLKDNGDGTVTDAGSGLTWTRDANAAGEPIAADKVAEALAAMNKDRKFGHDDWRLPTRDELLGLVDLTQSSPALPKGHPFVNVTDWYASSDGTWGVDMPSGTAYAAPGKAQGRMVRVWAVRGK